MSRLVGACIRKAADMRTDPANWAAVTMGRARRHAQRSPLAGLRSPGCPAGGTRVTFDSAASRHIVEVSRLFTWRLAMAAYGLHSGDRAAAGGRGGPGVSGGGVGAAVRQRSRWLRRTLADPGFYLTEAAVLALGAVTGLLGAAAPWFVVLLVYVCRVIASLRHPATAAAVVRCRKRTPRCALVREPWSAGPALGPNPFPLQRHCHRRALRKPPRRTQGETHHEHHEQAVRGERH